MFQITLIDDDGDRSEILYNFIDQDFCGMMFDDFMELVDLYSAIRRKVEALHGATSRPPFKGILDCDGE